MRRIYLTVCMALAGSLSIMTAWSQCAPGTAQVALDINNVNATMLNGGDMWWDFNNASYEIPKGSGISPFFSNGLWVGGLDTTGSLRLAGVRYRQNGNDYWPGPLDSAGQVTMTDCLEFDRFWKVDRSTIDDFVSGNTTSIPASILDWPGKGNPNLPAAANRDLAPFVDTDGDEIYNPANGDYPAIKGDQAIWWVINDVGNLHTETGSNPIGMEIHVMAYAYATNDHINNTTFYQYTLHNKSGQPLNDTYIGLFVDPDLGGGQDDYVASDSSRNLGICYNGDPFDATTGSSSGYGANPPVSGVRFLESVEDANGQVGMSSFQHISGFGSTSPAAEPLISSHYYNYLSGTWRDGSQMTQGGPGYGGTLPTKYVYPGNPSDTTQWSECTAGNAPGERKFIMSFGPFTFTPGESQDFTYAAIWHRKLANGGGCEDLDSYKAVTDTVADFYDSTSCKNFEPLIAVTLNEPTGTNADGNILLDVTNAGGSLNYAWSNGSTAKDLTNVPAGQYTVVISNDDQCYITTTYDLGPVGINTILSATSLKVYPNPARGIFQVEAPLPLENIEIMDILGNRIQQLNMTSNKTQVDLTSQPAGVYFLKVQTSDQVLTKRLINRQ